MTIHKYPAVLPLFKDLKQTCSDFGYSRSTTYRFIQEGLFVPPVNVGQRKSAWPTHELEEIARAMIKGYSQDQLKELVAVLIANRSKVEIKTFGEKLV